MSETDPPVPATQLAGAALTEQRKHRPRLTADQDARLRTLAALQELGELAPELTQLRRSYRERDQRAVVRPPDPVVWPDADGTPGRAEQPH